MNPLRIPGPPVVCRTLTGRRRDSHPARQPQAVSQAMRQAVAAAGRSVMVPPLESNQPCLVTRAAHQIALRRHNRSSPHTMRSSVKEDMVQRLRVSVGLSGAADGIILHRKRVNAQ